MLDKETRRIISNTSSFTDEEIFEMGGVKADICPICGWERAWGWMSEIEGSQLELLNPSGDPSKCC